MIYRRLIAILIINTFFFSFHTPLVHASRKHDKSLIKAITKGDIKKAYSLLEKGANPNAKNSQQKTALILASRAGYLEMVLSLLEAGADLHAQDKDGWTALMFAAGNGHEEITDALVKAGANIDAPARNGLTALMASAFGISETSIDALNYLLDKGADVNRKAEDGTTSLMIAALGGHPNIVKALIKGGAEINVRNEIGETALKVAEKEGHTKIVQMLKQPQWNQPRFGLLNLKSPLPEITGQRPAIAVPDLFPLGISDTESGVLSNKVRGFMINTGYFKVLSVQDMKNILEAQDFSFSERCDDTICLAKIGKMLHVEKIIGGSVGRLGKVFSLSLRMVDVESGEIEHQVDRDIECALEQLLDVIQILSHELAMEYGEARKEELHQTSQTGP